MSCQQTLTQTVAQPQPLQAQRNASAMANTRTVAFTAINPKQYVLAAGATVLWEPSVYGGSGVEKRLNLVLKVSEATLAELQAIELAILRDAPGICSVIREDSVRCKLDVDELRFWNADNVRAPTPESLKGAIVQAYIEVRGTWKSRTGTGLSIVCTDLQFSGEAAPVIAPFSALMGRRA